jgi:hypothetical protein
MFKVYGLMIVSVFTLCRHHHHLLPVLRESPTETWDTKAFQEAIVFSLLAAAQQIHIQRLSPENKGASPYIPLQAKGKV